LAGVKKIDSAQVQSHLDAVVRNTVEETLNKLLDEEADRRCNAGRYEHNEDRFDSRAGYSASSS
jgi:putative transposase